MKKLTALLTGLTLALATVTAQSATTLRFGYEAPRSDTQHSAAKKFDELLKEKNK